MSEIIPDTRDWTDVLAGGCSECGFTGTEDPTVVPATLAEAAATWQTVLTRDDATERRSPDRWSDVEYASHMRDVLDEFRRRTERMLIETDPTLDNFDGDTVAVESDYAHANPAEVAPRPACGGRVLRRPPVQGQRGGMGSSRFPFRRSRLHRRLTHALRTPRSPAPPRRLRSLRTLPSKGEAMSLEWEQIVIDREEKVVKNRLHLDFRPDDQDAEVARLLALGARRVDVGQTGDEPWVVLADPEGNEFCILSS